MKTLSFILLISIFFAPQLGFGQTDLKVENDDLYFTSEDRKELNKKIAIEEKRKAEELKKSGYAYNQFESSDKNLNDFQKNENQQNAELNQAPPAAEQSEEQGWYYDENAARRGLNPQNGQRLAQTQVYNYYGGMNPMMYGWNDPWMYGGGFYDPFMMRPGFNMGFGFNSWGGSYMSMGYGREFYDPFYDPFWGNPYAYRNPWRRPFWGSSYAWGYNNGYRHGFYNGYNAGVYNNHYLADNNLNRRTRTYTSSPRISRSATNARVASSRTRNSNADYSVSRNVGTERSRSALQINDRSSVRTANVSDRSTASRTANVKNANSSIYSRTSRTAQYARSASDNNVRTASYSGNRSRTVSDNASSVGRTNSTANNSSRYYNSARTNRSSYSSGRSSSNNRSATFGNSSSRNSSYGSSSSSSRGNSSYGRSSSSSRSSSSVGRSSSSSSRSSGSSSRSSGSSRSSSSSRGGRGG
ncbi:hypothetical protein [Marivirga sp.]|uniref:hypothetical protein n=1 Tax=Marivirga sp. TaxID=2018662 RepID=UPI0025DA1EE7|nr:hypothetical protein [Marivirga sp.]